MNIKQSIQEKIIRGTIIDDPHSSIFVNLIRKKEDTRVIVYMFGDTPWFIAAYYHPGVNMLTVEYYKSLKYELRFER